VTGANAEEFYNNFYEAYIADFESKDENKDKELPTKEQVLWQELEYKVKRKIKYTITTNDPETPTVDID